MHKGEVSPSRSRSSRAPLTPWNALLCCRSLFRAWSVSEKRKGLGEKRNGGEKKLRQSENAEDVLEPLNEYSKALQVGIRQALV